MRAQHFTGDDGAFFEYNHSERALLPLGIRHGDDGGFQHFGMRHQGILEIDRTDPLAAGFDQILGAVGDLHVAFAIDGGDVTRPEPAIVGPLVVLRVGLKVARSDPRPADL